MPAVKQVALRWVPTGFCRYPDFWTSGLRQRPRLVAYRRQMFPPETEPGFVRGAEGRSQRPYLGAAREFGYSLGRIGHRQGPNCIVLTVMQVPLPLEPGGFRKECWARNRSRYAMPSCPNRNQFGGRIGLDRLPWGEDGGTRSGTPPQDFLVGGKQLGDLLNSLLPALRACPCVSREQAPKVVQ